MTNKASLFSLFKKIVVHCVLLFLSVCFVFISGFLGTTNIESHDQMRNAKFGFPIPFIKQDLVKSGLNGYEGGFPHRFGMQTDFLDNDPSIVFLSLNFISSLIIVYSIILFCYLLIHRFWFHKQPDK
jgi:hypothetical protein